MSYAVVKKIIDIEEIGTAWGVYTGNLSLLPRHTGKGAVQAYNIELTSITKKAKENVLPGRQFANWCLFCCRKGYQTCAQTSHGCQSFAIPATLSAGADRLLAPLLVAFADLR